MDQTEIKNTIAERLKLARSAAGYTQKTASDELKGISFQQLQRYERGINQVSAARLCLFAELYSVPIEYFYPPNYCTLMQQHIRLLEKRLERLKKQLTIATDSIEKSVPLKITSIKELP